MPMVRRWVEAAFGKPPLTTVNADEAVALGAALQAAMQMAERHAQPLPALPGRRTSIDAIAHSLGMIAVDKTGRRYVNSLILPKNQAIPAQSTRTYKLRGRHAAGPCLEVFLTQGESTAPDDCAYLGRYAFSGLAPGASRETLVDVTYLYDGNGVVQVSACEQGSRRPLSLTVEPLPDDVPGRFALAPSAGQHEPLTVYIAVDLSGSMAGRPLQEAKKAARAFLAACNPATRVGLVSFSDRVCPDATATTDMRALGDAIDRLACGRTGVGNDTDPFGLLMELLADPKGRRCAIVLTDGVWAHQPFAINRARHCHKVGIEIFGVGFGGADKRFLGEISSSDAQGAFVDLGQLVETFSAIAQELAGGAAVQPM
jgi:hypothetical protein